MNNKNNEIQTCMKCELDISNEPNEPNEPNTPNEPNEPNASDVPECLICISNVYDDSDISNTNINTNSNIEFISPCCKKSYHYSCINKWCQQNNSCPYCRKPNIIESKKVITCALCLSQLKLLLSYLNLENVYYTSLDSGMTYYPALLMDITNNHNLYH